MSERQTWENWHSSTMRKTQKPYVNNFNLIFIFITDPMHGKSIENRYWSAIKSWAKVHLRMSIRERSLDEHRYSLSIRIWHSIWIDNRVAVKMLPPHADARGKTDFLHEMDFMKRLGYHKHIVSLLGCISDPDEPMLIVEYCAHGICCNFCENTNTLCFTGLIFS